MTDNNWIRYYGSDCRQESDVLIMKSERSGHLEAAPLPEDMEDHTEPVQDEDPPENSALNRVRINIVIIVSPIINPTICRGGKLWES